MKSLAVEVMHVPGLSPLRDACVFRLYALAAVYTEATMTFSVTTDTEGNGPWHTMRRCLRRGLGTGLELVLVLQDDIETAAALYAWAQQYGECLENNCVMQLYTGTLRGVRFDRLALRRGFVRTNKCIGGCATLFTREGAADFLAWADRSFVPEFHHDDERVCYWALRRGGHVRVPVPGLVQHCTGPSLLGHRGPSGSTGASHYYVGEWTDLGWAWDDVEDYALGFPRFDTRAWNVLGKRDWIDSGLITEAAWDELASQHKRRTYGPSHTRQLAHVRKLLAAKGKP